MRNQLVVRPGEITSLMDEITALRAENERLREYVRHKNGCRKLNPYEMGFECTCGASAALAKEGE